MTAKLSARHHLRVLVAEPNPDRRSMMHQALVEAGYQVDSVGDGNAAWEFMTRTEFDLLVGGAWLSRTSGLDIARRLYAQVKAPKIILLTGAGGGATRDDALEAGADEVISGPFIMKSLVACAESLLKGRETLNLGTESSLLP